jgi:flagellar hook-associated protein 2
MDAQLDTMVQAKLEDTTAYEADIEAKKEEMIQAKVDTAVDAKVKEKMNSDECKAQVEYLAKNGLSDDTMAAAVAEGVFSDAEAGYVAITDDNKFTSADEMVTIARDNLASKIEAYQGMSETAGTTSALSQLGLGEITGAEIKDATGMGMTVISAKDSQITLNGAILKGSSNTFNVNGMTFDLKAETQGQTVTLNVTNDVEAVYDSVKEFVTKYNEILKEMNELYDAPSARGYNPLTDEEREAMTEEQVEKWEKKIKDSLLRRDSTLGSLTNAMRTAMSSSVEVDGKIYSLSMFGISTSSDYKENGLLHIYGDEDDSTYSSMEDKLKKALTENPDTVIDTLTGVTQKLFDALGNKMKGSSVSSAQTFYNDKHINNQLKQYTSSISKWDEKLKDMEDKYYKQFAAMETALQKLNSQSSYLTGLFSSGQ